VWYPGTYTGDQSLTGDNYFASGVYYFLNGQFTITNGTVYGGHPSASEQGQQSFPASQSTCPQQDPSGVSGSGVEFVFGGTASMSVATGGKVELFSREGEAAPATPDISMVGVPPDWQGQGWTPNTPGSKSGNLLDMNTGNTTGISIHGLLYAPTSPVFLWATNNVITDSFGGIVASTLEIQSSSSANGHPAISVPVATPPAPRGALITATAQGLVPAEKPITSTAVIQVGADAARTVRVQSWRTRGPGNQ
jgi:hypothetical protein